MARIRVKGILYTNVKGEWRKIYKNKAGKEYIIFRKKRIYLGR